VLAISYQGGFRIPPEIIPMAIEYPRAYRSACLKITLGLLAIWFVVSFVGGILLRDWLDANLPSIGSAPFGFWIAQQGSIICFVLILISYAVLMNRLDNKHGYWEDK